MKNFIPQRLLTFPWIKFLLFTVLLYCLTYAMRLLTLGIGGPKDASQAIILFLLSISNPSFFIARWLSSIFYGEGPTPEGFYSTIDGFKEWFQWSWCAFLSFVFLFFFRRQRKVKW